MKFTPPNNHAKQELRRTVFRVPYDPEKINDSASYFAYHVLGIKTFYYQHQIMKSYQKGTRLPNKRVIICKPRQIGMSTCLEMLAVWYAATNQAKTGLQKNTKVIIVSRSDDQSKKMMRDIKNMIRTAKMDMSGFMKVGKDVPETKSEVHFNEGWIKCFPPTDAILGTTADLVICDEAAYFGEDGDVIFNDFILPTVSAVDGKIVISSTPNGQHGFFFEQFDPFDQRASSEYTRFWYHWKHCEDFNQRKVIQEELESAKKKGKIKQFEQSYCGSFTADETSFFENEDVERGVDSITPKLEEKDLPCSIGIDYGMTRSATCITVVSCDKGKIRMLYQFTQVNFDENLLINPAWDNSMQALMKRYNIFHVVVDDCPQGSTINKALQNMGFPVVLFNFRSDQHLGERNRGYYVFRAALKAGLIKYPKDNELMAEMKMIQEIRLTQFVRIKSPPGDSCDRVDALLMASYPFLSEDLEFRSATIASKVKPEITSNDPRFDSEWGNLKSTTYDFLLKK